MLGRVKMRKAWQESVTFAWLAMKGMTGKTCTLKNVFNLSWHICLHMVLFVNIHVTTYVLYHYTGLVVEELSCAP